jgi:hypothetical protein
MLNEKMIRLIDTCTQSFFFSAPKRPRQGQRDCGSYAKDVMSDYAKHKPSQHVHDQGLCGKDGMRRYCSDNGEKNVNNRKICDTICMYTFARLPQYIGELAKKHYVCVFIFKY